MMNEDRISQLPDLLICQILNHLSTKELVQTSVLSTRWRNLWLWVPTLEVFSTSFPDFDAFVSFGDRFFDSNRVACLFDSNRVACLQKLRLIIYKDNDSTVTDLSFLTAWMDAAAKRKIQHLEFAWCKNLFTKYGDLDCHTKQLRLCETLVYLKLYGVIFDDAEFLLFPCLKNMFLYRVLFPNKAAFEKLVSRCPVLEDLHIGCRDYDGKGFQFHSKSLKRLCLSRISAESGALVIDDI